MNENKENMDYIYEMPNQYCYNGMYLNGELYKKEQLDQLRKVTLRPTDVVLNSYPRTGTTLAGHMATLILSEEEDLTVTARQNIHMRTPYLERSMVLANDSIDGFEQKKEQRVIKTHMTYENIRYWVEDCKAKVILCTRNPKDALVSLCDFYRGVVDFGYFSGTWDDFFKMNQTGKVWYGDALDWITGWWRQLPRDNVHLVYYENIVSNPKAEVERMATFLDRNLSNKRIDEIVKLVSFSAMKKNKEVNFDHVAFKEGFEFVRKGEVGGWKNCFTVAQNERMNRQIEEKTKGLDIKWKFE